MIFVTVGTHEQPFNRLLEYMDRWAHEHGEEAIMQTGCSSFIPRFSRCERFYTREDMSRLTDEARIVVTHGGPCCYTKVLHAGKHPVVVPRRHEFGEHIDDHQVEICREFERRYHNIILVNDINLLGGTLENYDVIVEGMNDPIGLSHNDEFCEALSGIAGRLFE